MCLFGLLLRILSSLTYYTSFFLNNWCVLFIFVGILYIPYNLFIFSQYEKVFCLVNCIIILSVIRHSTQETFLDPIRKQFLELFFW